MGCCREKIKTLTWKPGKPLECSRCKRSLEEQVGQQIKTHVAARPLARGTYTAVMRLQCPQCAKPNAVKVKFNKRYVA